jgi:hypothetical protein
MRLQGGTHTPFPHWPVDRTVDRLFEELMKLVVKSRGNAPVPFVWFWPEGAPATVIVTHDVETELGRDFCSQLMDTDDEFSFKSSDRARKTLRNHHSIYRRHPKARI